MSLKQIIPHAIIYSALTLSLTGCTKNYNTKPFTNASKPTTNSDIDPKKLTPSDLSTAPYYINSDIWLNSKPLTQNDLEGKTIILDFWATWCPPCVKALPDLEKHYQKNKSNTMIIGIVPVKDVELSTINYHKTFLRDNKITFPIVLDLNHKTCNHYSIKEIPHKIIFQEGKIISSE